MHGELIEEEEDEMDTMFIRYGSLLWGCFELLTAGLRMGLDGEISLGAYGLLATGIMCVLFHTYNETRIKRNDLKREIDKAVIQGCRVGQRDMAQDIYNAAILSNMDMAKKGGKDGMAVPRWLMDAAYGAKNPFSPDDFKARPFDASKDQDSVWPEIAEKDIDPEGTSGLTGIGEIMRSDSAKPKSQNCGRRVSDNQAMSSLGQENSIE